MSTMTPSTYRVAARRRDTADTCTLELEARNGGIAAPAPGQFTMLYAWGVGEVPISVSGLDAEGRLVQTIRDVGAVTHKLCALDPGTPLGVRGPLGRGWPLEELTGKDVVVVAGGLGLAPLRLALLALVAGRERFGKLLLLYGARTPADLLYRDELDRLTEDGLEVQLTVDAADSDWDGPVGVVGKLVARAGFDPANAAALMCGPEVMMRFTAVALAERGVPAEKTYVSLERSMKCGIGQCGHCQIGPTLVCIDGPVYSWAEISRWLAVREL
jgi:anaerobic sulfite reductase subunit B